MINHTHLLLHTMLMIARNDAASTTAMPEQTNNAVSDLERCYPIYGCFSTDYPWTDVSRPISLMPESPEKINVRFCLYTEHNPDECEPLVHDDILVLYRSFFNPLNPVFFIIHGFMESYDKPWVFKTATELLKNQEHANVITVDWSGGSGPPYSQAVANTRLVGVVAAHMLNLLTRVGVEPKQVHVIGHSLGAHVAGYMGHTTQKTFHGKLGRISGLDPAGPHFSDTEPIVRLDYEDADFVDVIHTDANPFITIGFGIEQPIGHIDFYPNGGSDQPGCSASIGDFIGEEMGSLIGGLRRYLGCNHLRSYEYFIASINPVDDKSFSATECNSWQEYKNGTCFSCRNNNNDYNYNQVYSVKRRAVKRRAIDDGPVCSRMGFHANSYLKIGSENSMQLASPKRHHIKMFLMTTETAPYTRHHYRVKFLISCSERSLRHGGEVGLMSVTLQGEGQATQTIQIHERTQYFEPGSIYQVVVPGEGISKIKSVILELDYKTSLNPLSWRIISAPRIYLSWITIESLEYNEKVTFCPAFDEPAVYLKPLKLKPCVEEPLLCKKESKDDEYEDE